MEVMEDICAMHRWWKSALVGEPEIDTAKVDSTCKIDDYDQATQVGTESLEHLSPLVP
jgi:hypothetical protein